MRWLVDSKVEEETCAKLRATVVHAVFPSTRVDACESNMFVRARLVASRAKGPRRRGAFDRPRLWDSRECGQLSQTSVFTHPCA